MNSDEVGKILYYDNYRVGLFIGVEPCDYGFKLYYLRPIYDSPTDVDGLYMNIQTHQYFRFKVL
jgi:hypothetical protein